jgi:hypothetical protein
MTPPTELTSQTPPSMPEKRRSNSASVTLTRDELDRLRALQSLAWGEGTKTHKKLTAAIPCARVLRPLGRRSMAPGLRVNLTFTFCLCSEIMTR